MGLMESVGQNRRPVWRCMRYGKLRTANGVGPYSDTGRPVRNDQAMRSGRPKTMARLSQENSLTNVTSTFVFRRLEDIENLLEHSMSRLPYTEWCGDYSFLSYARLSFVLNFWNFLSLPFPIDFLTVSAINSQYKIDQLKPFTYIVIIIYYRTRFSSFR